MIIDHAGYGKRTLFTVYKFSEMQKKKKKKVLATIKGTRQGLSARKLELIFLYFVW